MVESNWNTVHTTHNLVGTCEKITKATDCLPPNLLSPEHIVMKKILQVLNTGENLEYLAQVLWEQPAQFITVRLILDIPKLIHISRLC